MSPYCQTIDIEQFIKHIPEREKPIWEEDLCIENEFVSENYDFENLELEKEIECVENIWLQICPKYATITPNASIKKIELLLPVNVKFKNGTILIHIAGSDVFQLFLPTLYAMNLVTINNVFHNELDCFHIVIKTPFLCNLSVAYMFFSNFCDTHQLFIRYTKQQKIENPRTLCSKRLTLCLLNKMYNLEIIIPNYYALVCTLLWFSEFFISPPEILDIVLIDDTNNEEVDLLDKIQIVRFEDKTGYFIPTNIDSSILKITDFYKNFNSIKTINTGATMKITFAEEVNEFIHTNFFFIK